MMGRRFFYWFLFTDYPKAVLYPLDVAAWGIWLGDLKQTISEAVGDKARSGRRWALALDWLFSGHFMRTDHSDQRATGLAGRSLWMFTGLVFYGSFLAGVWFYHWVARAALIYVALLLTWFLVQLALRRFLYALVK